MTTMTTKMTTKQYLGHLKRLGVKPNSKAVAALTGLSLRQCQRLAAGANVPPPVAKLLRLSVERMRENGGNLPTRSRFISAEEKSAD